RFVDTANLVTLGVNTSAWPSTIVVGPTGTTYLVTGSSNALGNGLWKIPADMSSATKDAGFASYTTGGGPLGGPDQSATTGSATESNFGSQIAISPDGSTLYFKTRVGTAANGSTPGNEAIVGYSLSQQKAVISFGGVFSPKETVPVACSIQTNTAPLATVGDNPVALDSGPRAIAPPPAYGPRVVTFGPGGAGCPARVTSSKTTGVTGGTGTLLQCSVNGAAPGACPTGDAEFIAAGSQVT